MIMKALLLVLVFSPAVFAQNLYMDDSQIANGRFWRETPHIAKMMYLIGVGHGLQIALVRAGTDGKCDETLQVFRVSGDAELIGVGVVGEEIDVGPFAGRKLGIPTYAE